MFNYNYLMGFLYLVVAEDYSQISLGLSSVLVTPSSVSSCSELTHRSLASKVSFFIHIVFFHENSIAFSVMSRLALQFYFG